MFTVFFFLKKHKLLKIHKKMTETNSAEKKKGEEIVKSYWYPHRTAALHEVRAGYEFVSLSLIVIIPVLAIFVSHFAMTQTNMLLLMQSIVSSLKALQAQDEYEQYYIYIYIYNLFFLFHTGLFFGSWQFCRVGSFHFAYL